MKNEYIENNNYYSLIIDDKYEVKFDKEYLNIVKKVKWKYKKEHNEVRTTNSNQTMGYFLFGENANKKVLRKKQTLDYRKENIYINNIYSKHEGFYEVECYDGKSSR